MAQLKTFAPYRPCQSTMPGFGRGPSPFELDGGDDEESIADDLAEEADAAMQDGTDRITMADKAGHEHQTDLASSVSENFSDDLARLLLAALRKDAAGDALAKLRWAIAREIGKSNALMVLNARQPERFE